MKNENCIMMYEERRLFFPGGRFMDF